MEKTLINGVDINNLLMKEPFKVPIPIKEAEVITDGSKRAIMRQKQQYKILSQEQFVCEYYPSGHRIFDREDWKDDWQEAETGQYDKDGKPIMKDVQYRLQRRAIALQQMIVTKRLSTITGYPVNFQDSDTQPNEDRKKRFSNFKQTWLDSNMEVAWYELCESILITGDGAMYMTVVDDKVEYRVFSYLKGDTLIPHYDRKGNMDMFTRYYTQSLVDIRTGQETSAEYVDVWDSSRMYTYQSNAGTWELLESIEHGYGFIPIAYGRIDSAVWSLVQELIDSFEFLLSMLAENNIRLAFRMLLIKSDGEADVSSGKAGGTTIIKVQNTDDAKFLEKADISTSFELELNTLYDNIMRGAGIVLPNNKSQGDMPVGSSKLRDAPTVEAGMRDAKHLDKTLDDVVRLFKHCIGLLKGNNPTDYNAIRVTGKIDPFTVIDETEHNAMVNQAYANGVITLETAVERSTLSANDEMSRHERQDKQLREEEAMKAIEERDAKRIEDEEAARLAEESARIAEESAKIGVDNKLK